MEKLKCISNKIMAAFKTWQLGFSASLERNWGETEFVIEYVSLPDSNTIFQGGIPCVFNPSLGLKVWFQMEISSPQ